MRKHGLDIGLAFLGLAAFAGVAGWAAYALSQMSGGWRSLGPIWPYVALAAVLIGTTAGVLVWLAVYSARHGYDDRIDLDGP
ncbi:MAG: hypothetical protein ACHP9T_16630 [Caulobacterales bacterium]|jgi:hypothetical protein